MRSTLEVRVLFAYGNIAGLQSLYSMVEAGPPIVYWSLLLSSLGLSCGAEGLYVDQFGASKCCAKGST